MNRRRVVVLGVGVVAAALLTWGIASRTRGDSAGYRFVEVERGDVVSVVSSSGTLQATTTVQVGTQVSGQIAEILVDFNDRVKRGELIARIDPTLLQQEVRSAEASLERSAAELELRRIEAERAEKLFADELTSTSAADLARSNFDIAKASLKSADVNLERARRNLAYTEIRAPIDGVVVERNVDVGQTVAASLSAPQLFLIAQDLSNLQILASVDESDIGSIHEGQKAHFTVQAYPDETFPGTVKQVRLQSTVLENVVNYTAVVAVENPKGQLLPGMTTTVEFVVDRATDVLKVPNLALRFRPPDAMRAKIERGSERAAGSGSGARDASRAVLWKLDERGEPVPISVKAGITDGQDTAVEGPDLQEGMRVIAAMTSAASSSDSRNPFQQSSQRGPGPPGGIRP